MIITTIIKLWLNAMIGIIELLPQLPNFPEIFTNIVDSLFDIMTQAGTLIAFFLPPGQVIGPLVELSLGLEAFVMIYWIVMWVLKKIPVLNIH